MTDESASDGGGCLCCPKRTGQTPARSLPRKKNGKARTWMDEKSVRKSHGHHIPPAKGMGERALLLLGLLSLLTAANEVRHTDAQHRATSDPSEGHAVKTGEWEAGALLVLDGDRNGRVICSTGSNHFGITGRYIESRQSAILVVCRIHRNGKRSKGVVTSRSIAFGNLIRSCNKTRDINLVSALAGREFSGLFLFVGNAASLGQPPIILKLSLPLWSF